MTRIEDHEHKTKVESRRGYRTDCDWLRCVAHAFQETRVACRRQRRCGWTTEWTEVEAHCINSMTMDSASWDRLRADGVLYR